MRKLKVQMIFMELLFLLVVLGGSTLIYSTFGTTMYSRHKSELIKNAFEDISEENLAEWSDYSSLMLESYETEGLVFIIADQDYQPIYTSRRFDSDRKIKQSIEDNLDRYSKTPEVISRESRNSSTIRLRGICEQNKTTYYVCISEYLSGAQSTFSYTERFFMLVALISLLCGSLVMYWQSRKIAKPIENMAVVSRKMAALEFPAHAAEDANYEEAAVLAKNFNTMSDQLYYYIQQLEQANVYLTDQNDQKLRLEQARKEFVANISHELKTPLAVISSQVELLECMGDKVDQAYYYQSIHEEIQRMSEMIGNLLKLSFMEHKLEQLEEKKLDLSEVTEFLRLKYEALFAQKKIKTTFDLEPGCEIWGNREYMEQAVSNYLMNAFEHTGAGSSIQVSLKRQESDICLSVYNEGSQITEGMQEKIWESYYQQHSVPDTAEDSIKNKVDLQAELPAGHNAGHNAGLGLYIVKTIITIHGGTCGVRNHPKGVEFWFSVPEYCDKI